MWARVNAYASSLTPQQVSMVLVLVAAVVVMQLVLMAVVSWGTPGAVGGGPGGVSGLADPLLAARSNGGDIGWLGWALIGGLVTNAVGGSSTSGGGGGRRGRRHGGGGGGGKGLAWKEVDEEGDGADGSGSEGEPAGDGDGVPRWSAAAAAAAADGGDDEEEPEWVRAKGAESADGGEGATPPAARRLDPAVMDSARRLPFGGSAASDSDAAVPEAPVAAPAASAAAAAIAAAAVPTTTATTTITTAADDPSNVPAPAERATSSGDGGAQASAAAAVESEGETTGAAASAPTPEAAGAAADAAAAEAAVADEASVAAVAAEAAAVEAAAPAPAPAPAAGGAGAGAQADEEAGDVPPGVAAGVNAYVRAVDAAEGAKRHGEAHELLDTALGCLERGVAPPALHGSGGGGGGGGGGKGGGSRVPPVAAQLKCALLWRRGRNFMLRASAMERGPTPAAAGEVKTLYGRGLADTRAALEAFEGDADAHKYTGILSAKAARDMKEKIANAYKIREHTQRAIQLRPKDAVLHHILGVWCFEVASLGWIQRQVASALFGAPPTATFDEAVAHLTRSEELAAAPGGSGAMMSTRLKLAQALLAKGDRAAARTWIERSLAVPPGAGEDAEDLATQRDMAAKLGVKR